MSPVDAEICANTDKTNSRGDTEILQIGKEQGKDVANVIDQEETTVELNEGQAGSKPGKTPESRPPPDDDKMDEDQAGLDHRESRVALAGPNPEPTHEEFMANIYPNIHESLKYLVDEHVILEDPLSSSETLSSMRNLDDAYTIEDQFLNDKSTEDEPRKLNVEAEVVSNLSSQKSETLDNTTHNLGSRVFTLELWDFPHKINQTVNEVVKEAVYMALQDPLRDRFRELLEADMKEILQQQIFESGTYKSLLEHVALYKALEASMEHANRDEFFTKKDKSRKRRRDDQDPPPSPDSDPSKKRRHASDASVKDVPIPDDVNVSDSKDTDTAHLPKIKTRPDWLKHVPKEDRPATPELDWAIPPNELRPLGQVTIQTQYFFNKDLEYLVSDDKGRSAAYGISHWWFKCKEFYITRHSAPSDRSKVRSHIRILSVISLKTFERYGYTFLKEIVLRRADYKEYKISKADFKNLHLNDFEDLYLLHLQDWDASDFLFKEDYTIVSKPRAVIYRDRNDQKKMMRETEVHKFSDGMLNRILDKLNHMVKDFKLFKYNPGMET
ncbi:hypothetical protein Tco_1385943 [Tanacetum coccineum]